mmetsp:Transcript_108923/g.188513  ORF Transcript_108923/g.188513 Transcript_108923/m.188513 type:complete len:135 (-) Transcript_108923:563-967(-)
MRDMVTALGRGEPYTVHRHPLTLLLSDVLGGAAKTVLIVTLAPQDADCDRLQEVLTYAAHVRRITNNPAPWRDTAEVQRLRDLVKQLKQSHPASKGHGNGQMGGAPLKPMFQMTSPEFQKGPSKDTAGMAIMDA